MGSKNLYTTKQFAEQNRAFTEASLRWLIFQSKPRTSSKGVIPGNGLETALVRIGRRVLIDEDKFFDWVSHQNEEVK